MNTPLDEPRDSVNNYIVEKDREWVCRWEEREQTFRKEVKELREHYEAKMKNGNRMMDRFEKSIHDQQQVILKIRDIPVVGSWLIKWAGYRD